MAERPSAKRRRVCEHCSKEVNIKIYKEHKRLYYDARSRSWVKEEQDASSSEITSIDECDVTYRTSLESPRSSTESEFLNWSEQDHGSSDHEEHRPGEGIYKMI